MDTYSFGYSSAGFSDMPMNHKIFLAQFDAIKKLAGEGPCVMVGRCADYALADWKDCFSVFVHADFDWRINRIAAKYNKTPKEARDIITKTDKSRASYYNYYTNKNGDLPRATISALTAASTESTIPSKRLSNLLKFLIQQKHLVKATYS